MSTLLMLAYDVVFLFVRAYTMCYMWDEMIKPELGFESNLSVALGLLIIHSIRGTTDYRKYVQASETDYDFWDVVAQSFTNCLHIGVMLVIMWISLQFL